MADLTKWPRLLVTGPPVTEEQADDILVRTCVPAYLTGNDRDWAAQILAVLGFRDDTPPQHLYAEGKNDKRLAWCRERWAHNDKRSEELGILGLEYLYTSRIASAWIGGPHGWCDWDGTIGCSDYNIGKWPSVEDVTDEWKDIAEAFPYLRLTAQVVTHEGNGEVAAQWAVANGTVTVQDPGPRIHPKTDVNDEVITMIMAIKFRQPGRERGVTIDRLAEAVYRIGSRSR